MPTGRKPKPDSLKRLQGNPGKRPLNNSLPEPGALTDLKPPAGLDTYGRQAWRRNAETIRDMGLLTEADVDVLYAYCMAYSRLRRAYKALGSMSPAAEEYRKIAVTAEKAEQSMRLLAAEFGLTPASRERLHVSDNTAGPMDPMLRLLDVNKRTG